ncbi:MAG: DUF1778 domain-containing protein [Propionibacteriaceae bacterium]|nr:DUF1778 domain-containing protein [Propionibacteriaceae bacterium]
MSPTVEGRGEKTKRINLRATERQESLLRRAAVSKQRTMTDFVLDSAIGEAERVLAEQRWFVVTEDQHTEFKRLLDAPVPETPGFDRLFSRPIRFPSAE